MATGQQHAVSGLLFRLLLATGTLSAEHNVRMLTDFAVATQSSTFVSDNMLWSAEKVLDGCYDKSCTARTRGERHNWIRLDLGNVYNISTVAIYAVTEESCPACPQNGLTDINIEMSKILDSPQCIFTNVATLNRNINATIQQTDDGHSLPDSRYITLTKANHPIIIAEIHIFGDCPDSYCGRNCSKICFCKTPLTNEEKANEKSCHDGCLEGWEGEMCDKRKCKEEYFGPTCRYECRCIGGCDPWTGECIGADRRCYSTFSGPSCQRQDLNPVYLTTGLPTDGSTCINRWQNQILLKYTIRPSYVKITYKSDHSLNALKVQMSSSTDYLIPNQSPTGIGCGDKTEQFFQFNDVAVFNLTIQNITGELCEIQFFACAPGTFGSDCSSNCYCLDRKPCNSIDGTCPGRKCEPYWEGKACDSRCSNGTFGKDCRSQCHCINNQSCDYQTGKCPDGCTPGWTDIACNKPCPLGFSGVGCQDVCGHCTGGHLCHHISGNCSGGCEKGWQGPQCLQQAYYGGEDDHMHVEDLDGISTIAEQNRTEYDNQTATDDDKDVYEPDEELGDSSTSNLITGHTDQNFTKYDNQTTDETGLGKIFIISGSIGSAVIFTLVAGIFCLLRFRQKKKSRPITKAEVLEKQCSFGSSQQIYDEVQEAASDAEQHTYYNVSSDIYETPLNRGINVPATQFTGICKKLLAAPKDGKPPLFYAFQSLQLISEHVYEQADQGVKESADGPRLSYKALVLRHHTVPEAEASFEQSSRKILKVNDISFMVSGASLTSVSLWETLVEYEIATCVHIGEPTMKKDEKLTFESLTIKWTSWKETDSVTECILIAESLESQVTRRITMLSCATWQEFMEIPIDLPGVISLTEYLNNVIDKGGSIMIQCEQTINKAVLLSVVSAILFKMKSTGLVDITGPVHDARLGVTGSLATYEQFKFLHDVVLFAIQKKRCCQEDT